MASEAGAVFVSIIPSMRGFVTRVNQELRGIGDVNVTVNAQFDPGKVRQEAQAAADAAGATVQIDADIARVQEKIGVVENRLRDLSGRPATAEVRAETATAEAELSVFSSQLAELEGQKAQITVTADTAGAEVGMSTVEGRADRLNGRTIVMSVVADTVQALASLSSLVLAANTLEGKQYNLHVGVIDAAKTVGQITAITGAALGIGGAVGGVAALGASVLALAPAAGVAAGGLIATVLGLSGVGDALKALQGVQDSQGKSAAAQATANLKLAQTMGQLGPEAQRFTMFLWGSKGALDALQASAAAGVLPGLQIGLEALLARLAVFQSMIGQFGAATGAALQYILTQLASPVWLTFFSTLAAISGPTMMGLAVVTMQAAQAVAGLILAMVPFTPAALQIVSLLGMLVAAWTPFIAQLVGALLPVAGQVLLAFLPLGPVLAALGPVLAVLAQAFAMVLGAVLQALAPILVALTPLIGQLAMAFATTLVNALVALTPFLVGLATFMSQHPQLILTVIGVLASLFGAWQVLTGAVSALLGPLMIVRLIMMAFGLSVSTLLAPLLGAGAAVTGFAASLAGGFSFFSLAGTLLQAVGTALSWLLRSALAALGPIGWLIIIFGTLFASSEQFRGAIMGLLGVFGQIIVMLVGALVPVFQALMGVVNMLMGVFTGLINQVAMLLVPIINMFAGIVMQIAMAALPPLIAAVQSVVPVFAAFGQIIGLLFQALQPLFAALMQLIMAILPVLVSIITSVVVPALTFFAQTMSGVVVFVLTNIVVPALMALVWVLTNVTVPAFQYLAGLVGPLLTAIGVAIGWLRDWAVAAFNAIVIGLQFLGAAFMIAWQAITVAWNAVGAAISFVWTTILQPIFSFIGTALAYLGAIIFTVLVAPFIIAWNIIAAIVEAVWARLQVVWYGAIVPALQFLATMFQFLAGIVVQVWDAIFAKVASAWALISAIWNAIIGYIQGLFTAAWNYLYYGLILPVWDAIVAKITAAWALVSSIWNAIIAYIQGIFTAAWNYLAAVVSAIWDTIVLRINQAWANISAIWNAIIGFISGPFNAAWNFLYDNIVKPVWDKIGAIIKFIWEQVIQPAWAAVAQGLRTLGDIFQTGTDRIGQIWNGIRGMLAKPINFMIDVVWNRGIVSAWNKVASLVGIGPITPLPLIPEFAGGGVYRPDRYTPGRDIGYAAMSGGEAVMRPEWTRVVGRRYVAEANAAARTGGQRGVASFLSNTGSTSPTTEGRTKLDLMRRFPLDNGAPGYLGAFAPGGVMPHVARAADEAERLFGRMPGGIGGLGARANVSDHPKGLALDLMTLNDVGLGTRVADFFLANAGRLGVKYIIYRQRINQGKGWVGMPDRGSPTANHMDHPHVSFNPGPGGGGAFAGGGIGGAIASFISTFFMDAARGAFDTLTNPAIDLVRKTVGAPPPEWRAVPPALATKMRDTVRDFVFRKAGEKDSAASAAGGGGGGVMGATSGDAPGIVKIISDVARSRFGPLARQAAIIGVATGLVESNLRNSPVATDHDSVGVFQQRPSQGWGSVAQIMNVAYAAGSFFSRFPGGWNTREPGALAQSVQRSAFPGRYAQRMGQATGLVAQFGGFDGGGVAGGSGMMLKQVIQPERVLSPRQTMAFEALVPMLDTMRPASAARPVDPAAFGPGGGRGGGSVRITGTVSADLASNTITFIDARLDTITDELANGRQP